MNIPACVCQTRPIHGDSYKTADGPKNNSSWDASVRYLREFWEDKRDDLKKQIAEARKAWFDEKSPQIQEVFRTPAQCKPIPASSATSKPIEANKAEVPKYQFVSQQIPPLPPTRTAHIHSVNIRQKSLSFGPVILPPKMDTFNSNHVGRPMNGSSDVEVY